MSTLDLLSTGTDAVPSCVHFTELHKLFREFRERFEANMLQFQARNVVDEVRKVHYCLLNSDIFYRPTMNACLLQRYTSSDMLYCMHILYFKFGTEWPIHS